MSQFSCRQRKYKQCENIRNHKMREKLMQCYKVLTLEFLCKDGDYSLFHYIVDWQLKAGFIVGRMEKSS